MENPNKVHYFNLFDYISKIKIDSNTLEHMEETNKEFDKYMKKLLSYKEEDIVHLWLIETANELVSSSRIEKHIIDKHETLKKDLFFDTLDMTHERIHSLRNFVMDDGQNLHEYRTTPVRVSYMDRLGEEHIYWHGAEPEDVNKFMDNYIDVYKSSDLSVMNSNPFLKSAIIKLLFIRIHPYTDGNGRTSRLLYSIKFTENVNKLYETNFKLCPLNISERILVNQPTYVKRLDNIYFDLQHDCNEEINDWFNFILNMADEQLYYLQNNLESLEENYKIYSEDDKKFDRILKKILYDIRNLDNKKIKEKQKKLTKRY